MIEEYTCLGFISLSLPILELSKNRHYFSALRDHPVDLEHVVTTLLIINRAIF